MDLGPGVADGAKRHRGVGGGGIVAEGVPEDIAATKAGYNTGQYLKTLLDRASQSEPAPAQAGA